MSSSNDYDDTNPDSPAERYNRAMKERAHLRNLQTKQDRQRKQQFKAAKKELKEFKKQFPLAQRAAINWPQMLERLRRTRR